MIAWRIIQKVKRLRVKIREHTHTQHTAHKQCPRRTKDMAQQKQGKFRCVIMAAAMRWLERDKIETIGLRICIVFVAERERELLERNV